MVVWAVCGVRMAVPMAMANAMAITMARASTPPPGSKSLGAPCPPRGVTADEEEVATPRRRQHQRRSTRAGLRRARAARRRVERWRNVVRAHKKQKMK